MGEKTPTGNWKRTGSSARGTWMLGMHNLKPREGDVYRRGHESPHHPTGATKPRRPRKSSRRRAVARRERGG